LISSFSSIAFFRKAEHHFPMKIPSIFVKRSAVRLISVLAAGVGADASDHLMLTTNPTSRPEWR
jgi:hypothetical protein